MFASKKKNEIFTVKSVQCLAFQCLYKKLMLTDRWTSFLFAIICVIFLNYYWKRRFFTFLGYIALVVVFVDAKFPAFVTIHPFGQRTALSSGLFVGGHEMSFFRSKIHTEPTRWVWYSYGISMIIGDGDIVTALLAHLESRSLCIHVKYLCNYVSAKFRNIASGKISFRFVYIYKK